MKDPWQELSYNLAFTRSAELHAEKQYFMPVQTSKFATSPRTARRAPWSALGNAPLEGSEPWSVLRVVLSPTQRKLAPRK